MFPCRMSVEGLAEIAERVAEVQRANTVSQYGLQDAKFEVGMLKLQRSQLGRLHTP
jgi:hypothetical protein